MHVPNFTKPVLVHVQYVQVSYYCRCSFSVVISCHYVASKTPFYENCKSVQYRTHINVCSYV
jgi:hypothetical protein